jgi:hypothetical protein
MALVVVAGGGCGGFCGRGLEEVAAAVQGNRELGLERGWWLLCLRGGGGGRWMMKEMDVELTGKAWPDMGCFQHM